MSELERILHEREAQLETLHGNYNRRMVERDEARDAVRRLARTMKNILDLAEKWDDR